MIHEPHVEEIDLQYYWLVLKRRWKPAIATFAVVLLAAFFAKPAPKVRYVSSAKLLLRSDQTPTLTGVSEGLGSLAPLKVKNDPIETQREIIFSLPILEDTIQSLNIRDEDGELMSTSKLARGLRVNTIEDTDVIGISYRSEQPELSAAVVNQVMRSYIKANVDDNRAVVVAARTFLEKELPVASANVETLSAALEQFNSNNNIISLEDESLATVEALTRVEQQITDAQVLLEGFKAQTIQLSSQLGMSAQEALVVATISQAPTIQSALSSLQASRLELAIAQAQYTSQHPTVQALQRQELTLVRNLQASVSATVGQAVTTGPLSMSSIDRVLAERLVQSEVGWVSTYNQLALLVNTYDAFQQQARAFPQLKQTQTKLSESRAFAQRAYNTLRTRFQEMQLAENQQLGSASIIELAVPAKEPSIKSASKKFLLAGFAGGIFFGTLVIFFLELIDRTIKTVKDGEKIFGYVVLGAIPSFNPSFKWPSQHTLPEATAEEDGQPSRRIITLPDRHAPMPANAYQMLQANLRFISSDQTAKALTITSSMGKEGRSEVCANLAASIAQAHCRVLLIDADWRSPNQHHLWNLLNSVGLSHVLVGEGSLSQALQPVSDYLTVLTAGVIPPNPMALLDSARMANLIGHFKQNYDYIIFDAPSLEGRADAAVLGNLTDGVLLVMRPRHVLTQRAIAAKSLLERSGVQVLGMVANDVNSDNTITNAPSMPQTQETKQLVNTF